jgi:L-rhamnose mutarotase
MQQKTDVLQKTVEATNTCCKRWYHESCIQNVRINNGNPIRREEFPEHLLSLNKNTVTRYDTQLKVIRPALVEKNKNNKKISWYLEEPNQETFAYFIENDEFQRKISNGEYRDFMQEGASIVARIKISKRGKQTERSVTNVFEMKCNEKTLSLEQKPSDFPLLRQETEEENSKADLERHQLKLF